MILLWGPPDDGPLAAVMKALEAMAEPVVLLDQRRAREIEVDFNSEDGLPSRVHVGSLTIDLAEVTAAYLRPGELKRWASAPRSHQHEFQIMEALWSWAELTPAMVLNRPSAMASNSSKPWQTTIIRRHDFLTPETLITNDPQAARHFWAGHGTVIYKSLSGHRSRVARLSLEHAPRWRTLHWCPTQFQEYIPGNDYRVHVVGQELFGCEVISTADDYRFSRQQNSSLEMRPWQIPTECVDRCRALVAAMDLQLAGVDLRRKAYGQWYCFEVNPSPAFTFYEAASPQGIAHAIARLLASPGNR